MNTRSLKVLSIAAIAFLLIVSGVFAFHQFTQRKNAIDPAAIEVPETHLYDEPVSLSDRNKISPTDIETQQNETEPVVQPPEPLEETKTVKYVRITAAAKVRAKDSASSKQLAVLQKNTEVEYVSESSSRYQIKYAGEKSGWIMKNCGEVFDKTVVIKYLPPYVSGAPIDMKGTVAGDTLASLLKNYATVGGSIAVIENGKVCYHYEYGYADKENKIAVKENTKFRIASVTKVFTGMMAMRQVDDGLLDLDKDLSDIMGYKVRNPSFSNTPITTRQLLTHTASFTDGDPIFTGVLRKQLADKSNYSGQPGKVFRYSNFGMGVAGAVMEKTSGQVISEYARDAFFAPMGLDASFDAAYLSDKSLVANCYNGSVLDNSNRYLTRSQPWGGPGETFHLTAGGLLISADDLASLFTLLLNNGQYEGKQYLSEKALQEMLSTQRETKDFTQCIAIRKQEKLLGDRTMYYHNGVAYGIHSLMALDMNDKSGVIVITSGSGTQRNDNSIFAVCDDVLHYCYSDIIEKHTSSRSQETNP